MFFVDTNILLYAANASCREHAVCRTALEKWRRSGDPWYVSWLVILEFLRVITHARVTPQPWNLSEAWRFIHAVFESSSAKILLPTERHMEVADEVYREYPALRGNILYDGHTAVLMREHGLRRIYTHDADFYRFKFLEVVDPLGVS